MKNRHRVTPEFLTPPAAPPPPLRLRAWALYGAAALLLAAFLGALGAGFLALTALPTPTPAVIAPTRTPTPTITPTLPPTSTPTPTPSGMTASAPLSERARVVRVINVSTIEVDIDGARRLVYYIGLGAPPDSDSCFAEGLAANARLVEGQSVRLERDATETDEIGRLPRYVYVGERLINADLLAQGVARFIPYTPNNRFDPLFAALATDAQAHNRGCYSGTTLVDAGSDSVGVEAADCGLYSACNQFGSELNFNLYIAVCPAELALFDAGGDGRGCNQRVDWGYPP